MEQIISSAIDAGEGLLLTIEPPDCSEPYSMYLLPTRYDTDQGRLYGKLVNGKSYSIYLEYVADVAPVQTV